MKRRDEHPSSSARGTCHRCGLTVWRWKTCPPGFWMKRAERDHWQTLTDEGRKTYEARLLAAAVRDISEAGEKR